MHNKKYAGSRLDYGKAILVCLVRLDYSNITLTLPTVLAGAITMLLTDVTSIHLFLMSLEEETLSYTSICFGFSDILKFIS